MNTGGHPKRQAAEIQSEGAVSAHRKQLKSGEDVARLQRVQEELAKADVLGGAEIAIKLLVGIPLCLLGPLICVGILKGVEYRFRGHWLPGFGSTFFVVCLVIIPVLLWLERRSRGEFYADAVRGEGSPFDASSYGEYRLQSAKLLWIGYAELALTGPRLLWDVNDAIRGGVPMDQSLRTAAAGIVIDLLDAGEGLPLAKLVRTDRSMANVAKATIYLQQKEWVGVSSSRDRVWLASDKRKHLAKF